MKKTLLSIVAILLASKFSMALAQGDLSNVELTITPVAGNVYMVQRPGGGGNIAVFVGPEGVLLVDSLFAPLSDKLVAAVKSVSAEDIRFLVNTHIHIDHVGGNANLAQLGVLIFAHDNTRRRFLQARSRFPRAGGTFVPQQPEMARPVVSFNDTLSFYLNDEQVMAFLVPPAHTDGDVFVYFPDSDVLHLGDVYRTTSYPIIDTYNGGTLKGTLEALSMAIEIAGEDTKIIPGHGLEVVGRSELQEFRAMIVDIREQVKTLIEQGKKLAEVLAANPTAQYDAQWTNDPGWGPNDFLPIVYYELGGSGRLADQSVN